MFASKDKDLKNIKAWYCISFSETINNRVFSRGDVEQQMALFYAVVADSIRHIDYHKNNFFLNETSFNDTKQYQEAINNFWSDNKNYTRPQNEIILVPQRWSYAYRDPYYTQIWAGFVFFLGTLVVWFFIYTANYKEPN